MWNTLFCNPQQSFEKSTAARVVQLCFGPVPLLGPISKGVNRQTHQTALKFTPKHSADNIKALTWSKLGRVIFRVQTTRERKQPKSKRGAKSRVLLRAQWMDVMRRQEQSGRQTWSRARMNTWVASVQSCHRNTTVVTWTPDVVCLSKLLQKVCFRASRGFAKNGTKVSRKARLTVSLRVWTRAWGGADPSGGYLTPLVTEANPPAAAAAAAAASCFLLFSLTAQTAFLSSNRLRCF